MLNKTYFILPRVETLVINTANGERIRPLKKLGHDPILNETKNKIGEMRYSKWSKLRKSSNDFEFPLDSSKIEKPISRAYFKLLELIKDHALDCRGNTLHLAEAPGGFIEATRYVKQKDNMTGVHYTFSILGDGDTPIYNRTLIRDKNIVVLSNRENRGDLYSVANIRTLINQMEDKNIMFITSDGGFTENNDFASKEQLHHHLIFNEIVTTLCILSNGGSTVLKIFDIFTELTFDFIYLLSYLFDEVRICKPNTSRPTNSEKYIVCKGYMRDKFDSKLQRMVKSMCSTGIENYSSFIHKGTAQLDMIESVNIINTYFLQYQIYVINNIIQIDRLNLRITKSQENIDQWISKYY